jgi:hypothetical protein
MFALISTDGTVTFLPDTIGRDVMKPLVTGHLNGVIEKSHSWGKHHDFRAIADDTARLAGKAKNDIASAIIGHEMIGAVVLVRGTNKAPDRDLPLTQNQIDTITSLQPKQSD